MKKDDENPRGIESARLGVFLDGDDEEDEPDEYREETIVERLHHWDRDRKDLVIRNEDNVLEEGHTLESARSAVLAGYTVDDDVWIGVLTEATEDEDDE